MRFENRDNRLLFWVWSSMKQRCLKKKNSGFVNYGGRGISVCDRWNKSKPFISWALNSGWKDGLHIDRIDNDSGYSPENCRFVTRKVNNNNRRKYKTSNKYIGVSERTYFGKDVTTTTYRSRVRIDNKTININEFTNSLDAAVDRDSYVINNNLGRRLNFPQPITEIG